MKVYFAADHAGFELKARLMSFVLRLGMETEDCGALSFDPGDDYPALIATAARKLSADVAAGKDSRAILIGASGQGEAMVANRFKGVRCALFYGESGKEQVDMSGKRLDMLASTRQHNDANALSLGARFLSPPEAEEAVKSWLAETFSGEERHRRRTLAIDDLF